ncbi:hypothetical protein PHMEG_0003076 [Phytophthora megakarya]|uniref:Dynein heavy chain n=1 Tax=Phytophthora megakarya TaxID=4795 RepID=A0A225WX52_9STRA|nr:hypothetical protein PHMEG_0003076 [Phytophthora megakarya]
MTSMQGLERIQQMIFFFSWKRRAEQQRLTRVRERLACSLFTCHPIAGPLLMEVRDVCSEIEREAEMEYVKTNTSYTVDTLAHIHREHLRIAKTYIAAKIHSLCTAIDGVTRDIPRCRKDQGGIYTTTDYESFSTALKLSTLSERMYTLLRLVDFHISEAVYQHVTRVVKDLRARICGQPILESDTLLVAVPGLYVCLQGNVNFEGDVNSSTIRFTPAKIEVLELVHSILMQYCVAMDRLPRVLTDHRFQYVLTPIVPSVRSDFAESLLKPSHLVLESYGLDLREMRSALESHFRRVGILQQEHLRCIRAIRVAERELSVGTTRRYSITSFRESDEEDVQLPELPDLSSSAVAYELAQKTWNRFAQYANNAAPVLQVGCLLLDQRFFVERLRRYVSKRITEINETLPLIYQNLLTNLLKDVDGRIEKVTKIPTNLAEANIWLAQVTSMIPTHPFRQRLDMKIDNLVRLRELMKECSLQPDIEDSIRKLELMWGSVIETLLMCLARVEERGSEHRRSVQDVITKVEEYITGEMQLIIKTFEELPSGYLVVMDVERKQVVQQFEEYDRAIIVQHAVWIPAHSNLDSLSAVSLSDKLPSELLLLYIITALELRQWFKSWKKLQEKWLGTPLTRVHPGAMINRLKLFRRRLVFASSRLLRLSSKDFELIRVFDRSIDEMLNCNRIFQAITGGTFSEARWQAMNQLLNIHVGPKGTSGGGHLTLRLVKEKCSVDQIETFLAVCDEYIVEAKLRIKVEQVRQRLARIDLRVEEINYSVQCEGVAEALAQLDEIAVDLKLCLFGQNPELQVCLELRADLERKVVVCEHILSYQKHWRFRCEASKLHEVDEFFSKRFSDGSDFSIPRGRKSQHKAGLKQEEIVWQAFLDSSHAWSDRLRRLFFVSPQQPKVEQVETNPRSLLGRKSTVAITSAPMTLDRRLAKSMTCTLDNVMESFEGFDFETNFTACERGIELVQNYLEYLREKSPRMYCLDDIAIFRLLLRDSDMKQLLQSLSICFPRVHRFAITRIANRVRPNIEEFGKPEASSPDIPARTNKTTETIVIVGIEGMYDANKLEKSGHFRLPVAKIGRIKFWFTRLEEEMSSMVQTDLRRAFEWATHKFDTSEFSAYDSLLPQSIVTAYGLQFTFEMNRALRSDQYDVMCYQLHQLHVNIRRRVDSLVATVISTSDPSVQPNLEKQNKVERNELLPTNSDFLKVSFSNHSSQSTSMSVCCQIAHLQIPLGQEFVGWGRITIVSPFTQRCSYALFSALRMHHTALVVPYNEHRAGTDPTAQLWSISQTLLRPCIEFSCEQSAGATTAHHLGNLMNAISKLNGYLIIRHLLQLSLALVSVATNSLVLSRYHGGKFYGASAIFIPLGSTLDLPRTKLVQSIRTQFRAVAVSRPDIKFVIECMLITDGFVDEQVREINVVQAFEAIDSGKAGPVCACNVEVLISRVFHEARRLHKHYHVVWDTSPLTKGDRNEEAVAAAVSIYLESAYALPTDCEQFEVIMELWRALQTFPAALVYGSPGSGKTSCITALHRALMALELSEQSQEHEDVGCNTSNANPSSLTQLVILNPQLLSLGQFYSCVASACGSGDIKWNTRGSFLKWILIDGEIDNGILDRLLESDKRACSSASSLPSSSIMYRDHSSSVLSGDCSGPSDSPRLLFELPTLANLSPSALRRCWALRIPTHCITVTSIIDLWRARWESQLVFPPDSRGFEAKAVVFRTVDVLTTICIQFVVEDMNQDQATDVGNMVNTGGVRLGCLTLNRITQTALTLVSSCCFQNKSLLQELSYLRLVELVAFAVLWGYGGHLSDPCKTKLEHYVRKQSNSHSETQHLAELPRCLLEGNHFEDVWNELQSRFAVPTAAQTTSEITNGTKSEAKIQSAVDSISGQVLVLIPAATSLIRICAILLHSSHSFLFIGPAASGKTSLLRWLMRRHREAEAEKMKIETSLDERHLHGILDWTQMPAAWFHPSDQQDEGSRAKMREETELFTGRSRHSFVFLDDLDASGAISDKVQVQFVRTMLDHRIGYSTKHGEFQRVEKQIGASMRFDGSGSSVSPALERFMRHFIVFRVPTYTQNELLSVFRVRFQQHFIPEISQSSIEYRLPLKGDMNGGCGQQLSLEEVILRATVDFAVEMTSLQQLGHTEHSCLYLFNLHHVNMLLERTLVFATDVSASTDAAGDGTTLVQLGKAHQCWLSELQNIFLSNCHMELSVASSQVVKVGTGSDTNCENIQKKISMLLRHLSEKYFSVAFRGRSDHNISTSVESLYFLVKLTEHHVLAPLLQPRLVQLRDLLNEYMTTANGVSRRSSDQARGISSGGNSTLPAIELMSGVLMEIAATSGLDKKTNRPYTSGQLIAFEMKLLLSSSWCLTQVMHLAHALNQQQQVIVSSKSRHARLLSDRLLRFVCDLHGFEVHTIHDDSGEAMSDQLKKVLRVVLGAAGIRQKRVALWVREGQVSDRKNPHTKYLLNTTKELCLGKIPSLALLPGGQELRDELVLSCIQSRKQLEIMTESDLMAEFQQRIQKNFRLCILEDQFVDEEKRVFVSPLIHWMKTRPSCHWRRLDFSEFELHRTIPEMARAALISPPLCGVNWDIQHVAKYVTLCQNMYSRSSPIAVDPTSQLDYFLSFMTNITVTYRKMVQCHQKNVVRLEHSLKTLTFVRDKVVPTLERRQRSFELQHKQIHSELECITLEQLPTNEQDSKHFGESGIIINKDPNVDRDMEEARWILRARHEELMMTNCETNVRLEQVSRFIDEWHHVTERMNDLLLKWSQELDHEKRKNEYEFMSVAMHECAQRVFAHVSSLSVARRNEYRNALGELILKNIEISPGIERCLMNTPINDNAGDRSAGITRLIWSSCFSFLRNPDIYHTLRKADELCDRVPVIVDPSGVLQRFLVHTFSGHTLFSSLPSYGSAGEAENEYPNSTKESMVISCDDSKLEHHLREALRLKVPVLLVNFRSGDSVLLDRLQPFLSQTRLSHSPPRRPMLHELTLKYYEGQPKHKQIRTSTTSSATTTMPSVTQTAISVGGRLTSIPKRAVTAGKRKVSIDPVSVAAAASTSTTSSSAPCDVTKAHGLRDTGSKPHKSVGNDDNDRFFQIYAVATTPVPLEIQHALVGQFAHFTVSLPDSELETLFEVPYVGKTQPNLLKELRGDQIGLADCWKKLNQTREQLDQLLATLMPAIADDSPFAARRAKQGVTIQLQEHYNELTVQLAKEYQAELIWSSRLQNLQDMNSKLDDAATAFTGMASQLVGVARCMATMSSSLMIGARKSPFYLQSVRYLENTAAQQLSLQGDDNVELSNRGLAALIARISSGFVSDSHRLIFFFLVSIQQQLRTRRASVNDEVQLLPWCDAIIWLTTSRIRKARLKNSSSVDLFDPSNETRHELGIFPRWSSQRWSGDLDISLVERLRRRVKLGGYLFKGWKASGGNKNTRGKQLKPPQILADGSPANSMQTLGNVGKTGIHNYENKELVMEQLQQNLDKLLADSETMWYEWKTTRLRLQLDMEQLLSDIGYEDASMLSATRRTTFPTTIALTSLEELSVHLKADTVADDEMSVNHHALARLLLAKTLFPYCFAQVLLEYLHFCGVHAYQLSSKDNDETSSDEYCRSWSSPASLVVDIAPSRGKHSRAHLPRALIISIYTSVAFMHINSTQRIMMKPALMNIVDLGHRQHHSL